MLYCDANSYFILIENEIESASNTAWSALHNFSCSTIGPLPVSASKIFCGSASVSGLVRSPHHISGLLGVGGVF